MKTEFIPLSSFLFFNYSFEKLIVWRRSAQSSD